MPLVKLIADSGSTKTTWCILNSGRKKMFATQGMSPYFLNGDQLGQVLENELRPHLKRVQINELYFYGTGCANPQNAKTVQSALKQFFPHVKIRVDHDLSAAAEALCQNNKGIACILGTGSNSCVFNGKKIVKNSPGLGYVLGDEGSGAYLGKKVIQHYLYDIFDEHLRARFDAAFVTNKNEILNAVYKQQLPNRYLASFAIFLVDNRGHYMIENIIEDGLNDFFFYHINRYKESRDLPIHFVGSIAYGFKDVLENVCNNYHMHLGQVLKEPMEGLVRRYRG